MIFVFLNSPGHIHSKHIACKCFFMHIKTLIAKTQAKKRGRSLFLWNHRHLMQRSPRDQVAHQLRVVVQLQALHRARQVIQHGAPERLGHFVLVIETH